MIAAALPREKGFTPLNLGEFIADWIDPSWGYTLNSDGKVTRLITRKRGLVLTPSAENTAPAWSADGFMGRPCIEFTASTTRLGGTTPNNYPTTADGYEIWAFARQDAPDDPGITTGSSVVTGYVIVWQGSSSQQASLGAQANQENAGIYKATVRSANGGIDSRLSPSGPWHGEALIRGRIDNGSLEIEQDGVSTGPIAKTTVAAGQTSLSIGNNSANTNPFQGGIADIVILRGHAPDPLRTQLRMWGAARYPGLAVGWP